VNTIANGSYRASTPLGLIKTCSAPGDYSLPTSTIATKPVMDFYNAGQTNFFLTDITKWWWYPQDADGQRTLVVSVTESQAQLWVVTYTILVGLIFMIACELATAIVLTIFPLGTSGTRHAMLVSYYNGGRPTSNVKPMFGYLWNALWRCRKGGRWIIDWSAVCASLVLLLLAVGLISGDVITKFFLGGKRLIVANVAQANPNAVFYPSISVPNLDETGEIPFDIVYAFKNLVPQAVYQASARKTNAQQRVGKRVQFNPSSSKGGVQLPDGSRTGPGARFEYQYNLTGFEMGLRDAPKLVFKVHGVCETHYGSDAIGSLSFPSPAYQNVSEESDLYPYFEDDIKSKWTTVVYISRENYTAPWAQFVTKYDQETFTQNKESGGYRFLIVPHVAWRQSGNSSSQPDPWYDTEESPAFVSTTTYNPQYRVKRGRPALRCTQNDTYTYNGKTVNHVTKLPELPGLNSTLSPFIMNHVFGREFGSPVFSKLLGNLPFGTIASTAHFIPQNKRLDVTRISLEDDFRGLVDMSFVYSREVVRNTVLLYSGLRQGNDSVFNNAADIGDPAENADFFLEGTGVASMSVFVLVVTPAVCALLGIILFVWRKCFNPESGLDNKSANARHGLRRYGFSAVHLFRYLDEEISRERKWSGRNSDSPYIRDLDAEHAVKQLAKQPAEQVAAPTEGRSLYIRPKILPAQAPHEPPPPAGFVKWVWNKVKECIRGSPERPEWIQFEIGMTRVWDRDIPRTEWKNIRRGV